MRIIFMGNGPFGAPALSELVRSPHEIAAVVARPDRPQGKHQRAEPGPIKTLASEMRLPIYQPDDANDPTFLERLASLAAELLVVVDFGQILSSECLQVASRGGINIHASLLPKYRGAAPVAWAVYHGEVRTGVSILQITSRCDAGAVIAQQDVAIDPEETAGALEQRLAPLGATLVLQAMDRIAQGTAVPIPQDESQVTRAPKLKKEHGRIRWDRSADQIQNQVRAMQPWPIAFTMWHRQNGPALRLQVLRVRPVTALIEEESTVTPGTVIAVTQDFLAVQTGEGAIAFEEVKPAGKKAMDIVTFLRGHQIAIGERLGDD